MVSIIDLIEAIGRIGIVAAVSSIVAVIVTQRYDLKRIDKQDELARSREDREFERTRDQTFRDMQLKVAMEAQDLMWPLQEQASQVQIVMSGLDGLATGRERMPAFIEESAKYNATNTRLEVLISRMTDETLAERAEQCRADVYSMFTAVPNEIEVDRHRDDFKLHYRAFQDQARSVIHRLMA